MTDHGDWALVGYSVLATALAIALALWLARSGRAVAAGVLAFLAVLFFALFVGSFENAIGIFDFDIDEYQPASLLLEALTIGAALVALRRFRAPLLVLPIAVALWSSPRTSARSARGNRRARCSRSWPGSA